jgi:3-methyl-2-oxobutanoate hydroxymethyltransferase
MSSQPTEPTGKRLTAPSIASRKGAAPIVALTAYTHYMARIADRHADFLLVGDSLGMVVHGYESTVPVDLDLMIIHGRAVVAGSRKALVVVDLPFGSYEECPQLAFRHASRVLQETGCGAVKLEGGVQMADTIEFLVKRGIPVMGHIGLTPQAVHALGGYGSRGRHIDQWSAIEADAAAVAKAGAFALVLEALAEPLARKITSQITIPTIGIGASVACDGQILVAEDLLGFSARPAKFVKVYADVEGVIDKAFNDYASEVRGRTFPTEQHTYQMKKT